MARNNLCVGHRQLAQIRLEEFAALVERNIVCIHVWALTVRRQASVVDMLRLCQSVHLVAPVSCRSSVDSRNACSMEVIINTCLEKSTRVYFRRKISSRPNRNAHPGRQGSSEGVSDEGEGDERGVRDEKSRGSAVLQQPMVWENCMGEKSMRRVSAA